jgi:hypothetical protein
MNSANENHDHDHLSTTETTADQATIDRPVNGARLLLSCWGGVLLPRLPLAAEVALVAQAAQGELGEALIAFAAGGALVAQAAQGTLPVALDALAAEVALVVQAAQSSLGVALTELASQVTLVPQAAQTAQGGKPPTNDWPSHGAESLLSCWGGEP